MNTPVIYYDATCALCHSAVRFILRTGKKGVFHFLPLSQLPNISRKNLPDSLVLLIDGKYFTEGAAVLKILDQLGLHWKILGMLLRLLPVSFLNQIYRFVAKNRKRWELNSEKVCPVVPAELRGRMGVV